MTDEPTPSIFVFLLAYGGFFAVSLLLFWASVRVRCQWSKRPRHLVLPDVVEDDGEYHD